MQRGQPFSTFESAKKTVIVQQCSFEPAKKSVTVFYRVFKEDRNSDLDTH